jgi:hypothetical protein
MDPDPDSDADPDVHFRQRVTATFKRSTKNYDKFFVYYFFKGTFTSFFKVKKS